MYGRNKIAAWMMFVAIAAWARPSLQFALHDAAGAVHKQDEWTQARAVVIFFVTTDCPLSNGYAPEMNRIENELTALGSIKAPLPVAQLADVTISQKVAKQILGKLSQKKRIALLGS